MSRSCEFETGCNSDLVFIFLIRPQNYLARHFREGLDVYYQYFEASRISWGKS